VTAADGLPFVLDENESSVPAVFARRCVKYATRVAIGMGARELRYAELAAETDRVARLVRSIAAPEPGRVVLLLDDRVRQVVGMLGVLKSGHAFVPLDPEQPGARLSACIGDAEPFAILCERGSRELAESVAGALPVVDLQSVRDVAPAAPARAIAPDDVAYLLYTSGTTATPKGVVQTHRNVLHNVGKLTRSQGLCCEDRITMLGNAVYAFTMSDVFGALLSGAALLPYHVRRQGVDGVAGFVMAEEVTIWSSVPTLFRHATEQLESERFPSVRLLKLAGEPVQRSDFERFRRYFPRGARFMNSLGATEFNTIRQYSIDHDAACDGEIVPVGHAVEATDILILDPQGRLQAPGTEGEIAIRSPFLSPGYWRRPDLTARSFVPDPEGGPSRVYRTGDLGLLRDDGCLLHFGRLDGQVRIRGHRVETAEIEAALLACPGVRAAAVVAQPSESGETQLVAWLASHKKKTLPAETLRAVLARSLPDYMLPARYAWRASLPQLSSGKIDRLKLAQQTGPVAGPERASGDAPRDEVERGLATAWCAGLRLSAIGRDDDFFELGGHSLVAARIVTRIQHELGVIVPLSLFRDAPTIARMAERIRAGETQTARVLVELQAGEAETPLVVVPGAGSDASMLQELARAMGPDQGVLTFQMPGLRPGERPPGRVEAAAELYLAALREHQPHGPYSLAGESYGGVVAFEMAQRLHAAGERVALLALLDTYAPGHPLLRRSGPATWPRRAHRWFRPRGKKEVRGALNAYRGLRQKLQKLRFHAYRLRHGADCTPPVAWRYTYLRMLCFGAHDRYQPRPYPGSLLLVRAERQAPADLYESTDDLGWRPLVKGAFEVRDFPGRHGDEVRYPHVSRAARFMRDALRAELREGKRG
jgi:amino acid adenylation domain-containing protein